MQFHGESGAGLGWLAERLLTLLLYGLLLSLSTIVKEPWVCCN